MFWFVLRDMRYLSITQIQMNWDMHKWNNTPKEDFMFKNRKNGLDNLKIITYFSIMIFT